MSSKFLAMISVGSAILLGSLGACCTVAVAAPTLALNTGSDPAESITTQIEATGTATDKETGLSMTLKTSGGQPCGANYEADVTAGGTPVFTFSSVQEGAFSKSTNHTFPNAGSYLLCAWLNKLDEAGDPLLATASLTAIVRTPHLALSIAAPATVAMGQTFQLVTTAQAEVERPVSEYVLASTGRGCPANASAASGMLSGTFISAAHPLEWNVNGGPFSTSVNEILTGAGQYLVCAYVQYPSSQSPPEITASAVVTAVSPPPPCVVPKFTSITKLTAVKQAIKAAHCSVGKVRYAASRKIRSGYVSALSPATGKSLSGGTPVNVTISTGPPCVVPHVNAGSRRGAAELKLRLSHCATGPIHSTRSGRYRRGRVVRLGTRSGQVLRSHAPVEIVVSRGRHGNH